MADVEIICRYPFLDDDKDAKKSIAKADITWITTRDGKHIPISADAGGAASNSVENIAELQAIRSQGSESAVAKSSAQRITVIDRVVQRYAEERNERILADRLGAEAGRDNEPWDLHIKEGTQTKHLVEVKTMISNQARQIKMSADAVERKRGWASYRNAEFHTVVLDHTQVYNKYGEGKHGEFDEGQIFYRRGAGSFKVDTMHSVARVEDLQALFNTPTRLLPEAARPPKGW